MSISDRLDEIEARADEAADLIGALAAGTSSWRMRVPVDDEDSDVTLMRAVEGCEKAVAALRAVLNLHTESRLGPDLPHPYCGECGQMLPCATRRAIATALGEEQ